MQPRPIPPAAVDLVAMYEGYRSTPYLCPAGIATIGYGRVIRDRQGRMIRDLRQAYAVYPQPVPEPVARRWLIDDLREYGDAVQRLVTAPITDGQFGALVSFAYNLGAGALERSTLLRRLNARDYPGAAGQFSRWIKAAGVDLPGLARRRAAERAMFEGVVT